MDQDSWVKIQKLRIVVLQKSETINTDVGKDWMKSNWMKRNKDCEKAAIAKIYKN